MFKDNYKEIRAHAQRAANETGFDHGVEKTAFGYRYFMLPRPEYRVGHELRCEVVMCENMLHVMPGHGPVRT